MGGSFSSNVSEQEAVSNIFQSYSGTCNVECNNNIDDVNIAVVNSQVGGDITLTQVCSANMSCIQNSSQSSVSDVMFKAANASTANPAAWSTWANPGEVTISQNTAIQNIQQAINNTVSQNCNSVSTNSINDAQIFAQNSYIGGNIQIGQYGSASASCNLQSQMAATASATGTIENCATGGKTLLPSCLMGKGNMWVIVGIIIVLIAIGVGIFFLWKHYHVPLCTTVDQVGKIKCTPPPCGTPGFPEGKCTPAPKPSITPRLLSAVPSPVPSATPSGVPSAIPPALASI